jgi:hypothetical protein
MANAISRLIPQIIGDYPKSFTTLFNKISISSSNSEDEIKLILWKAFEFGRSCHSGQKRLSGKPYFSDHCVSVDLNDTIFQTQKLSRELVLSHPQNLRKKLKFY